MKLSSTLLLVFTAATSFVAADDCKERKTRGIKQWGFRVDHPDYGGLTCPQAIGNFEHEMVLATCGPSEWSSMFPTTFLSPFAGPARENLVVASMVPIWCRGMASC